MRKQHITGLAALSAAGLLLAGCSAGSESEPSPEPTYDQPVDLTMTLWTADEKIIGQFQALADEFRADNPELGELTIETIPFADYNAQLSIRLAGGDAPDLGWIVESATPAWVDSGALLDVSTPQGGRGLGLRRHHPRTSYDDARGTGRGAVRLPVRRHDSSDHLQRDAFAAAGLETPNELVRQRRVDVGEAA